MNYKKLIHPYTDILVLYKYMMENAEELGVDGEKTVLRKGFVYKS